ncbi:hypothetical protein [Hymenobacter swuensis]|uniref:Uncharacterized protein n=1 Tax=Hymenobacter swuensis DY53 TaxID=1227739 RepID=W8F7H7_9BACT|nr:hypothetical protein [Hymenobacter swuensis]AHJ98576.1 hypothetical protein Hsw_2981 [Hymenobacter swuensis DY53]
MRFLLLFTALLLPQVLFAQFESGYYVLIREPNARHVAQIKMPDENKLFIKEGDQKKQELDLEQVAYFKMGNKNYRPVSGLSIKKGKQTITHGFAEVLDSGQVMLYAYSYLVTNSTMMTGNGVMYGGGSSWATIHLVENTGQQNFTIISAPSFTGTNKEFRETLRPFLAARADMVKYLDAKLLLIYHLEMAVRALNHGEAFVPVDPWKATTN